MLAGVGPKLAWPRNRAASARVAGRTVATTVPLAAPSPEALQQVQEIKAFYGVQSHALEMLLRADSGAAA